jgi:hypothetical protein
MKNPLLSNSLLLTLGFSLFASTESAAAESVHIHCENIRGSIRGLVTEEFRTEVFTDSKEQQANAAGYTWLYAGTNCLLMRGE